MFKKAIILYTLNEGLIAASKSNYFRMDHGLFRVFSVQGPKYKDTERKYSQCQYRITGMYFRGINFRGMYFKTIIDTIIHL